MQNPFQQPGASFGANAGNMNDPLGFVKKLWGDMQLPGMVTPTLSVDELDKQIKDLKTVESWLTVNMNMLRGTIQALEVQRATISALKTMGESFANATGANGGARGHTRADDTNANASWPMHGQPEEKTAAESEPEPTRAEPEAPVESKAKAAEKSTGKADDMSTKKTNEANVDFGFSNPSAWWTTLQDQFKHALSSAMQEEKISKKEVKPAPKTGTVGTAKRPVARAKATATKAPSATVKKTTAARSKTATPSVKAKATSATKKVAAGKKS